MSEKSSNLLCCSPLDEDAITGSLNEKQRGEEKEKNEPNEVQI